MDSLSFGAYNWKIIDFTLTEKYNSSYKIQARIHGIVKVEKNKLAIKGPLGTYNTIVYSYYQDLDNNYTDIVFVHPFFVMEYSKAFNFFIDKNIKQVLEECFKKFNIKYNINLPNNAKKDLWVQYQESYSNFITRLCILSGAILVAEPNGSVTVKGLKSYKKNNEQLSDRTMSKSKIFYHGCYHQSIKYNYNFFNRFENNPRKPFLKKSNNTNIQIDYFQNHYKDLQGGNKLYQKYNNNNYDYVTAIYNKKIEILSKVGTQYLIEGKYTLINANKELGSKIAIKAMLKFGYPNLSYEKVATSLQKAIVVGKTDNKIEQDQKERVFVRFFCDEKQQAIAVKRSEHYVHKGGGSLWMPRVGDEVLVNFLRNNPEHPIIVGSIYNVIQKEPDKKYYGFQIASQEQSERKSSLWFDSIPEKERVMLDCQKDLDIILQEGNYTKNIKGENTNNSIVITDGNFEYKQKQGNYKMLLSKGDRIIDITGNSSVKSSKTIEIKATNIKIIAKNSIEIKGTKINIDGQQVNIKAKQMKIEAINTTVAATAKMEIKGAILKMIGSMMAELKSNVMTKIESGLNLMLESKLILKASSKLMYQREALMIMDKSQVMHMIKSVMAILSNRVNLFSGFLLSGGVIISGIYSPGIPSG